MSYDATMSFIEIYESTLYMLNSWPVDCTTEHRGEIDALLNVLFRRRLHLPKYLRNSYGTIFTGSNQPAQNIILTQ